ncbi:hypothetical protein DI272_20100 [Streptomyces sp. Act143]|uniref:hypothetical protein n=1 Tax=Streptomyces sp. Act143 TaxID=2200760 RepID=UPI000D684247|nr:hypothetical protein [Streptomyces sp. Act143]PWI16210.1 hypothetical protein DI272_20100 [Streptomyces sp. Act143]
MASAGFVQTMGPFLTEALSAYGDGLLDGGEIATASEAAGIGRQLVRTAYRRTDDLGRALLAEAVAEGASAEVLGDPIRRALRKDPELERELAALLPGGAGGTTVIASGERSVAAGGNIGIAITGDGPAGSRT